MRKRAFLLCKSFRGLNPYYTGSTLWGWKRIELGAPLTVLILIILEVLYEKPETQHTVDECKVLILIILEVLYEFQDRLSRHLKNNVLILIILEVLYERGQTQLLEEVLWVLILIILEVLYESYHYNHVIFNRKQQKA